MCCKEVSHIRVGVYAICRNEEKYVKRWLQAMWCEGMGADRAYVLDTGSTDDTVQEFFKAMNDLGIPRTWLIIQQKSYDAFRFDTARNDNLAMTMTQDNDLDVLVSVDLDELLIPDFWSDLREMVEAHPNFQRIWYLYAWNHDESGKPKRIYWYDKVHPARGCHWIHAVHEEIVVDDPSREGCYSLDAGKIYLHHYADVSKSRSQYLPLLELRVAEEPDDISGYYYLMREYTFRDPASVKALAMANEAYIRMQHEPTLQENDCYPFFLSTIADIFYNHGIKDDAEYYYAKVIREYPHIRYSYIQYASMTAYQGRYELALQLLDNMELQAGQKYLTWYECDYNWTWRPMQIRAVALCWAGRYQEAKDIFEKAQKHIITKTDMEEAAGKGFFDDYNWLKNYLKNGGEK